MTSLNILLKYSYPYSLDSLPELSDGTGQVGGVHQTVVRKAAISVPRVITCLPR